MVRAGLPEVKVEGIDCMSGCTRAQTVAFRAPGKVAYLGQSGTLASALLDWAHARGIGFSHFLTIGDSADVSMPDTIDYLSTQRQVKAIMLHLEQVTDAKSFVRAVRNASRSKLVLAIKSSRFPQSQSPVEPICPSRSSLVS